MLKIEEIFKSIKKLIHCNHNFYKIEEYHLFKFSIFFFGYFCDAFLIRNVMYTYFFYNTRDTSFLPYQLKLIIMDRPEFPTLHLNPPMK